MSNITEDSTSKKLIQSYLFTDEFGNFFVSTCYRQSSSIVCGWYYETYAWKLNKDKHRTDWVVELGGLDDKDIAFNDHIEVCRQLELKGEYKEDK